MTKDYAKPSTTRKPDKPKPKKKSGSRTGVKSKPKSGSAKNVSMPTSHKGKSAFVLAILLGVFVYALYYLQKVPPTLTNTDQEKPKQTNTISKPATSEETEDKQRFKFYDLLRESKVVPPEVDAYHYKEKNQQDNYYYLVQTGSFRKIQDAERQKATIAFQGLKADIKTVENSNGSTWYRVMTGPFYDRSQMNSALDKLVSINIEPLVKKIKTDK